ncbi:hypothetical protein MGALJ_40150 [Mycobacterium gallinarum]|uniref:Lipoprotein n=1 Tax=Mycobacterium gallinarum TaxID=39689 RepID=A0A9W4FGS2_9MYCO|nr:MULTISPECIES: hypothetical protein [Mycobacterium]MDV3131709.1 hypothetical protein [Mycobacterium sp. 29Ha]BBY94346.1 hypothetical protein MGALJ_40150 [Mycobacterium gallinarum]
MKTWIVVATLMLGLTGCQSRAAQADPIEAGLDQEFALHGGRQVAIRDADLRLRFTDVLEDSRCPTDVECFWTGQARITVDAELGRDAPASLEFNTNPAPGQGTLTNDVGGYVIELRSLDPYPKTPDDSPALSDYSATLVVRKVA